MGLGAIWLFFSSVRGLQLGKTPRLPGHSVKPTPPGWPWAGQDAGDARLVMRRSCSIFSAIPGTGYSASEAEKSSGVKRVDEIWLCFSTAKVHAETRSAVFQVYVIAVCPLAEL